MPGVNTVDNSNYRLQNQENSIKITVLRLLKCLSSPTLTTVMMNEATSQGANKLPPYNVH